MRLEVIDFPSDPYGELGNLREQMTTVLHRATEVDSTVQLLEETLKFCSGKLKEIKKVKSDALKKIKAKELAMKKAKAKLEGSTNGDKD